LKSTRGNHFEDFERGQVIHHPTPRTVTSGDVALYVALTGDRRPLSSADTFGAALGLRGAPLHDLLVFHIVFGKTVGQVSLNAVANLGYADVRFLRPVFPGDTLRAVTEVLGTKETSSGKSGIVWVRTRGLDQRDEEVLRFCRWVMVEKRGTAPTGAADAPTLPGEVTASSLRLPEGLDLARYGDVAWAAGGRATWEDYQVGERIHHVDGMTINEADHTAATRLYQNSARVHFNAHVMAASRFGRRLVYGGHVISVAYALAMNGLENAVAMLAWNGGAHTNPTFAGDTIYAFSDILDKAPLAGRQDAGALRVRLSATKNVDPGREPFASRVATDKGEAPDPRLVLELDCWLAVARRGG
jgi:2-methylfumaryl-CoA hydratase